MRWKNVLNHDYKNNNGGNFQFTKFSFIDFVLTDRKIWSFHFHICDALIFFLNLCLKQNQNPPNPPSFNCYPQSWTKPYPSLPANKLSVFFVGQLKKLHTTITWKNITRELDDSQYSQLGSYECHAFAVDEKVAAKRHGFSVSVIKSKSVYISWGVLLPYSLTIKISAFV